MRELKGFTGRMALLAVLSLGVAAGLAAPATAAEFGPGAETGDSVQMQARGMFERAKSGTLTPADRESLAADPNLAAAIPDATKRSTESRTVSVGSLPEVMRADMKERLTRAGSSLAAATCSGTNRWQNEYAYSGGKMWEFHSYVHWCWTSTGTIVGNNYGYLISKSGNIYDRGVTNYAVKSLSATAKETHHLGKIENCVFRYGCLGTWNAHNWVTVKNRTGSALRWTN